MASPGELNELIDKLKELSVSELLQAQETITQELITKTAVNGHANGLNGQIKPALSNPGSAAIADKISATEPLKAKIASLIGDEIEPSLKAEVLSLTELNVNALQSFLNRRKTKDSNRLGELNHKAQKNGSATLTKSERNEQKDLFYQHDQQTLLRSVALLILRERGVDYSPQA